MASRACKPLIGITIGDPCGIGPEVSLRALADPRVRQVARCALFGSDAVLRRVAQALKIRGAAWRVARAADLGKPPPWPVPLTQCGRVAESLAMRGRPFAGGGRASVRWIEAAARAAMSGAIDAMVTAPISKEAIHMGACPWAGHTEMLAHLTGAKSPVMMMAGRGLRVALVTTHVAIADLPKRITTRRVLATLRVTAQDLRARFRIARPRLGVCALNPHAGEAGLFGREEETAIAPAIRLARSQGIDCCGPIPADALLVREKRRQFDAIVAMFHDQATIPVKMASLDAGVNVTLGLPIIRTSPDHGTAYDIAAQGVARPGSMISAIRMAARMACASRRSR